MGTMIKLLFRTILDRLQNFILFVQSTTHEQSMNSAATLSCFTPLKSDFGKKTAVLQFKWIKLLEETLLAVQPFFDPLKFGYK